MKPIGKFNWVEFNESMFSFQALWLTKRLPEANRRCSVFTFPNWCFPTLLNYRQLMAKYVIPQQTVKLTTKQTGLLDLQSN